MRKDKKVAESETIVEQVTPVSIRKKSNFAGDVLKLVGGTTVAQALTILVAPILSRLYTPEAFGTAAVFASITSILGVIACLRYELAIMLPESDEEAANLLGLSLIFTVLTSLLTVPVVWWGREPLLLWLNAPELSPYLWLVPPAAFFAGMFLAFNYWNSRTKQFGRLSITRVTSSAATTSTQLGGGLAGYATGGTMIAANVMGQAIATTILGGQIWRDDSKLLLRAISWREILCGVRRYRKFPLYGIWSALLNTISWQLPAFMLSGFFSSTVVGYYALGFRILKLPMSLIGQAIGQVFFQRAAEANVQGNLVPLVEGVFRRLVLIGMFPMLTLAIIGQDLYVVVFGANWAEAGVYTQILAVWAFFWFISSPMSTLFSVLEKQEFGLKLNSVLFLTRLGSLAVGGYLGNARLALLLFAATGVLLYGYLSFALMAAAGVSWSRIWEFLGQGFLYFAPFGLLLILLSKTNAQSWLLLGVASAAFGIYGIILWKREPELLHLRSG